uniref:Receptor activity modifying protein 2 n=1 Tax=Sphenodon punctatus TaxID=8508 RepID=A0A8D0GLX3_SPHPU
PAVPSVSHPLVLYGQLLIPLASSFPDYYVNCSLRCGHNFIDQMNNVSMEHWCEWRFISRPYSHLRHCLETLAEKNNFSYPNNIAEHIITMSHKYYFHNCTQERQTLMDPPEDLLLAMIIAPICLIPFLVALVVWKSKDGETQS